MYSISFCWEIILLQVGSTDKIKTLLNSWWNKVPCIEGPDWLSVVLYSLHVWLFTSNLCFMTVPVSGNSSSYISNPQAVLRKTSKKVLVPEKTRVVPTDCCINNSNFKVFSLPLRSFAWKLVISHCFVSFPLPY